MYEVQGNGNITVYSGCVYEIQCGGIATAYSYVCMRYMVREILLCSVMCV